MTKAEFLGYLRAALNHLHDPDRLIRSPLAAVFGVPGRHNTYSALQGVLTDAISSLEPDSSVPTDSRAWRIYDLLTCRYVQELSVPEVANQLGVSVRHLRREQSAALGVLAHTLWERFGLEDGASKGASGFFGATMRSETVPMADELAWLREAQLIAPTDLRETLTSATKLVGPLAKRHQVELQVQVAEELPGLAVHPVALDQILLNILGVAIHRAAPGDVVVQVRARPWEVQVDVNSAMRPGGQSPPLAEDAASLCLVARLASMCSCRLSISPDGKPFGASLFLPAFEQMPVLVIDDNEDTLQLLKRYAMGSRYRLVGVREPERALDLARTLAPQIIVLDVMMPQVDGWRLLGQLREHPATSHVPIIVCTILAQEDLARSLGAADFVRKPVTQDSLLAALDAQVAQLAQESC